MRISYLAATTLAVCLLPLSMPAFADCSRVNCTSTGNSLTYSSDSYGAVPSSSSNYSSYAYANQSVSTRYGTGNIAACPSGSTRAQDGYCMSNRSRSSVGITPSTSGVSGSKYGSSFRSTDYSTGQVVPFATTVSKISKYRVAGLGENEFLSPTTCPVNVYNPEGAKVLGCYSVVKRVQVARQVQITRPVQVIRPAPQRHYQQVRVERPVIYVRYPVPVPILVPMPTPVRVPVCRSQPVCNSGCSSTTYSRYGNAWPRMNNYCRGW